MHSPEHVHVLWEMVLRAKETPWQGPGSVQLVADFIHFFNERTQLILTTSNSGGDGLVSTAAQVRSTLALPKKILLKCISSRPAVFLV